MKQPFFIKANLAVFVFTILSFSCNKDPYTLPYSNAKGYVIGKETCKGIDADEYWLVDLTFNSDTPQYGDSLRLNGVNYTNVVKLKGLGPLLQQIGMRVSLDFKTITPDKVITTGCSVTNPSTYPLKELFIINQGEIR